MENPQYRPIHVHLRCIAEYLHWNPAFTLSFSAYEPGELMAQEGVLDALKQACDAITAQN